MTQEAKMSHCGKKTSERNFSASEDEIQACFGYDKSRPNRRPVLERPDAIEMERCIFGASYRG